MKVMQHISAVHVRRNYSRIAVESLAEVSLCLLQHPIVFLNVTGEQRDIRLFRKHLVVLRGQLQQRIVLLEMQQIVSEIDNDVSIRGKLLDGFSSYFSR